MDLDRPVFAIAIPTVNRMHLLRRALDSALAQPDGRIEVIVSNNGSTDGTRQLLDEYADPRLRVYHRNATLAPIVHGRTILDLITAPLMMFLPDDDWVEPGFVERVLELWTNHPELSLVHTRARVRVGGQTVLSEPHRPICQGSELLAEFYARVGGPLFCASTYRTDDVRECLRDIPDDVLVGDVFVWLRLAASGSVGFVDEPLANYTWHNASQSSEISADAFVRDLQLARNLWTKTARESGMPAPVLARLERLARRYERGGPVRQLVMRYRAGASRRAILAQLIRYRSVVGCAGSPTVVPLLILLALPRIVAARAVRIVRQIRVTVARGLGHGSPAQRA